MDKSNEWEFNRNVEASLIEKLKGQRLWQEKLKGDCEKGEVFLAIRNGYISFYHKGGSLFKFDNKGFSTHRKHAIVIDVDEENAPKNYIYDGELSNIQINNFFDGYDGIKKNCELYPGVEAEGVSKLYQKSSYLCDEPFFVLDIEIAFKKEEGKQARIDILLYDTSSRKLRFVEAKHFSNSDIWSKNEPKVITQIKEYEGQIAKHEKDLVDKYGLYIDCLNLIFNKQFKFPQCIDPNVSLLIFGFDEEQRRGDRFQELIYDNLEYSRIPMYCKGDPKGLNAEKIWKQVKVKTTAVRFNIGNPPKTVAKSHQQVPAVV